MPAGCSTGLAPTRPFSSWPAVPTSSRCWSSICFRRDWTGLGSPEIIGRPTPPGDRPMLSSRTLLAYAALMLTAAAQSALADSLAKDRPVTTLATLVDRAQIEDM